MSGQNQYMDSTQSYPQGKTDSFDNSSANTRPGTTLEEPVHVTLWRDIRMILVKLKHVLAPKFWLKHSKGAEVLRDWDLWGPLLISLLLAITLSSMSKSNTSLVFSVGFLLPWIGAFFITGNTILLGGTISFFQAVSLLCYCTFPLSLASFILLIFSWIWKSPSITLNVLRVIVSTIAMLWSTLSSIEFFSGIVAYGRRALAVYPLLLMYTFIWWMILKSSTPVSASPS